MSLEYTASDRADVSQLRDAVDEMRLDLEAATATAQETADSKTDDSYTPTTPGDWNGTAPTTITDALDRCATLLKTLNGGTGP